MESTRLETSLEDQPEPQYPVKATIRISISGKKKKEAIIILRDLVGETKLKEGCISCRLYQDVQEDRWLMLEETWTSQKLMERHLRSDRFLSLLLVMEMATEAPEVRFEVISHCSGIETIEKVRVKTDSPGEDIALSFVS
jgi:quinol monooxygenase YgiN